MRWLYGSGDRSAADGKANTFVGIVARPVCCSDPFWIAPANMASVAPVLTLSPRPDVKVELKYDVTRRLETADAVYAVPLQPYPGTAGRIGPNRISAGPSVLAAWSPVPEVIVSVSYTEQSAEGVLKAAGGRDSRFAWASLSLLF